MKNALKASSLLPVAVTVAMLGSLFAGAKAHADRPPQYVLMAFDGSYNHKFWRESTDFARQMTAQGKPLKFTYFISGVYYVGKANKNKYSAPGHGVGKSNIGWGEGADDLLARYDETNDAFKQGNEIGSHANSHYDGSKWTLEQWLYEFKQFNAMIFDFFNYNGLSAASTKYPNGWAFSRKDVVGFRAPLLGYNNSMFSVLKQYGFRYDTSKSSASNYWPDRTNGFWNFPLAQLRIAGTGVKTLSMDYNFFYAQSKGRNNPSASAQYESQMYETYIRYFQQNYNGNRAPIHIGHHFSQWNGGAYWRAMKRVAQQVCGMPEVKCVTYSELADYMDRTGGGRRTELQNGQFERGPQIALANPSIRDYNVDMKVAFNAERAIKVSLSGPDARELLQDSTVKTEFVVNGQELDQDSLTLDQVRGLSNQGQLATVQVRMMKNGREILSQTHEIANVGTALEAVSAEALEDRAMMGDLPEAHFDERMN